MFSKMIFQEINSGSPRRMLLCGLLYFVAQGPYVVYVLRAGPMTCIRITVLMLWPRLAHVMYVSPDLDTVLYHEPHDLFFNSIILFRYFAFLLFGIAQVAPLLAGHVP